MIQTFLIPIFPLISFVILSIFSSFLSRNWIHLISIGGVGTSFFLSVWLGQHFLFLTSTKKMMLQTIWNWTISNNFKVPISFKLDELSFIMVTMITFISFLVYIYSIWYMRREKEYSRFFSYMNLFVSSMLFLVLSDNLLLIYLSWEGIGICSYLLIGFHRKEKRNGISAVKSFLTTRIGDIFLILSLCLLYTLTHTLNYQELSLLISNIPEKEKYKINLLTWSLLIGVIGKSSQFPLNNWLSDAMVGPTPASALIHSSTMVVSGVYLITRLHDLFLLNASSLEVLGITGSITLLLSSISALFQIDIKKILAYSTMGQIGYMFISLSICSWNSAISHLLFHSFLKTSLFLLVGIIIDIYQSNNILNMGNLSKISPYLYVCFLIGSLSLSSFPWLTSTFYSKNSILLHSMSYGNNMFFISGLFGEFLTTLYIFRVFFIVFHRRTDVHHSFPNLFQMNYIIPIFVLSLLSTSLSYWMISSFFPSILSESLSNKLSEKWIFLEFISIFITILGIGISSLLWLPKRNIISVVSNSGMKRYFFWLIDDRWINSFYKIFFFKPYLFIAKIIEYDFFSRITYILSSLRQIFYFIKVDGNKKFSWHINYIGIGLLVILTYLSFGI